MLLVTLLSWNRKKKILQEKTKQAVINASIPQNLNLYFLSLYKSLVLWFKNCCSSKDDLKLKEMQQTADVNKTPSWMMQQKTSLVIKLVAIFHFLVFSEKHFTWKNSVMFTKNSTIKEQMRVFPFGH